MHVVQVAVSAKTNGATPLVMASKNGHLQMVEFLISELNADVEQVSPDYDESQDQEFKDRGKDRVCGFTPRVLRTHLSFSLTSVVCHKDTL